MRFVEQLALNCRDARESLTASPAIARALSGEASLGLYTAFLEQAYHHVRHTVPLMMAVGSRLGRDKGWLQSEIVHYIEEEQGHEQWILNDLAAAGADAERVARGTPGVATDAMVAYAYDVATRRNPVGFFGMVFVLEGTSIALALNAADRLQQTLDLPNQAFSYLRSHGRLDQEHVEHLAGILDRLDLPEDRTAVTDCARAIYWLYEGMFRGLAEPVQ